MKVGVASKRCVDQLGIWGSELTRYATKVSSSTSQLDATYTLTLNGVILL